MIGELVRKLEAGTITPADMGVLASALDHIERRSEILQGWIAPGASYPIISFAEIGRLKITEQIVIDDGAPAISLEADGDAFFGSDISAPATTSLAIFSNAQTYNGEAMGAGDMLFGDNSSSKANLLWDASTGQIKFRGGTTVQGYIDTDGSAVFGAGVVRLGSGGVTIESGENLVNSLSWVTETDPFVVARIYATGPGTTPNRYGVLYTRVDGEADGASFTQLAQTNGYFTLTQNSVSGTGISTVLVLSRRTSEAVATEDGCGYKISFKQEASDDFNPYEMATIGVLWEDSDYESLDSMMAFTVVQGGAALTALQLESTEAVFNEGSKDYNFRVEGDTDANLLFCDAGTDKVGIGDAAPGEKLDVAGNINATGVIKIDDVQVVSNRVVDARADDSINESTWDSTTAGVLDALRDAMITHGLIAAA